MGVKGLETYICERKDLFLKEFRLCNTFLVVDGSSVYHRLYALTKSDSAFGGDYDEYYQIIKNFFRNLQKCKVTSIVIIDGGHERNKKKTTLERLKTKLRELDSFNQGYCKEQFIPIFLKNTFIDALQELNIIYVQCELEADEQVAAVARALKCPLLSYDSDFYIFDVLYIPFNFNVDPVEVKEPNFVGHFISCSIYDINNFLKEFQGLDKSMMPLAATLLGNDITSISAFNNFFLHVIISTKHKQSYNQRKIHGTFNWLKKENFDSAVQSIVNHLGKQKSKQFLKSLNLNLKNYKNSSVLPSIIAQLNKLLPKKSIDQLKKTKTELNVPIFIRELIHSGKICSFVIDMINLRTYFTPIQIEDFSLKSCNFWSLKLIEAIYAIIEYFATGRSKPLTLYMINSKKYMYTNLEKGPPYLNNINYNKIVSEPKEKRLELIYKILSFSENDIKCVSMFSDDWSLYIVSFIYWLQNLDTNINFYHAKALILSAYCNQVIQKPVGYYRNLSNFRKSKELLMKQLKNSNLLITNKGQNFGDLLSNITKYDCLLIQQKLIPMRQTAKAATTNYGYDLRAIHFFNCFQSCLYHISQLNILLNYPFSNIKISDFYSGTLTYNFYLELKQNRCSTKDFEKKYFEETPSIFYLYEYITDSLKEYFTNFVYESNESKKRRRRRPRKKSSLNLGEDDLENLKFHEDHDDSDDDIHENYHDENNSYFILHNR